MIQKFLDSIKAIILGLLTVFSHLFKRPVTEEYPEKRPLLNGFFRGKHYLESCAGCGYCRKVCPSDAITIIKNERIVEKYIIDLGKCIFCGNCMFYCPSKSMRMSDRFELATNLKSNLKIEIIGRRK